MPAKALEPVDNGELWQVGAREGREIPRIIKIEKHCVLVKYTGKEDVV